MRPVLVLISLAAGLVAAQDFSTVPACGQTCFNNMKVAVTGCATDDQKCHCNSADYRNGLRDCVNATCPAAAVDAAAALASLTNYVDAVCAVAATAISAVATTAPAPSASQATATPSPAPATPSAAVTSPEATTTPAASQPPPPSSTAAASATVVPSAAEGSSSRTATGSQSSSTASSSSASSAAKSSSTSTAAADSTNKESQDGLSQTTKVGIAIGGAAAALGLVGVVLCIFLNRRSKRRDNARGIRTLNISDPMPGSGRSYAGDHHNEKYEVGSADNLDFKSRRYEDMLPRQTPRNMV